MSEEIERTYAEFLSRTTLIRRWLMLHGDESNGSFAVEMAANTRAWAIAWMSAAAESFWRPFLQATCDEFARSPKLTHRRKLRAQSIFFIDQMFSEVTRDLDRRWEKSSALLEAIVSSDRTVSNITIPYDGKTLKPLHVQVFWNLFQLPGDPFPSMIHKQSLETLAADRNLVAHGEMLPSTLGRLRTKQDVMSSLSRLEDTVEKTYVSTRASLNI